MIAAADRTRLARQIGRADGSEGVGLGNVRVVGQRRRGAMDNKQREMLRAIQALAHQIDMAAGRGHSLIIKDESVMPAMARIETFTQQLQEILADYAQQKAEGEGEHDT